MPDAIVLPNRKRKFSTRVRTGCITCRIRRIKCDEAKPFCRRCTSTGRKCDGYTVNPSETQRMMQPYFPLPDGNSNERNALYMFRTKIAILISSTFDIKFWTHDLLQAAEMCQTVRHAVAALSMAYKRTILHRSVNSEDGRFILDQYTKSINSLKHCLGNGESLSPGQKVIILITNLLFTFLCAIQGLRSEACAHLRSGLALLHEWKLATTHHDFDSDTILSATFLIAAYTQLDTQARIIIRAMGDSSSKAWSSHHISENGWKNDYSDIIAKAKKQLEKLYNEMIQTTEILYPGEGMPYCLSKSLDKYRRQLSLWDLNFGHLLDPKTISNSVKHLHLRRLLAGATLEAMHKNGGLDDSAGNSTLEHIFGLVHHLIRDCTLQERGILFSPVGGLIEALFFVSTRSTCTTLRQQAIDLLQNYTIIEGLWRSATAAEMAVASYNSLYL